MTGPEHYTEAEKLLRQLAGRLNVVERADILAEAQVRATLALAAASALGASSGSVLRDTWVKVAS